MALGEAAGPLLAALETPLELAAVEKEGLEISAIAAECDPGGRLLGKGFWRILRPISRHEALGRCCLTSRYLARDGTSRAR